MLLAHTVLFPINFAPEKRRGKEGGEEKPAPVLFLIPFLALQGAKRRRGRESHHSFWKFVRLAREHSGKKKKKKKKEGEKGGAATNIGLIRCRPPVQ